THIGHIHSRIEAWQDPFDRRLYDQIGGSYQIAQSLFAQADGGMFGTGFGQSLLGLPGGGVILPAAHTDLIYAVITNELGLVGACAVLLTYLLVCERGFKIALLARDSFSKLLATGLTSVFALQVFVVFASRWAVFDAKSLNDNTLNKRGVLEAAKIDRGVIRAGDGTVLARSVRQQGGVYQRTYPTGELFSHAIGYSFTDIGQAGL